MVDASGGRRDASRPPSLTGTPFENERAALDSLPAIVARFRFSHLLIGCTNLGGRTRSTRRCLVDFRAGSTPVAPGARSGDRDSETVDRIEDPVEVGFNEDGFWSFWCDPVVRRFVDAFGFDDAPVGEFVDDQVDEPDLVLAVALVVEKLGERRFRCRSVESDK